jgi:hypothetical protein
LSQAHTLSDVVQHANGAHDIERCFRQIGGVEIADEVLDVIVVGTSLLDARPIGVEPHDRGHSPAKPSGCLALTATDVETPLCSVGNGTHEHLEGMQA